MNKAHRLIESVINEDATITYDKDSEMWIVRVNGSPYAFYSKDRATEFYLKNKSKVEITQPNSDVYY